MATNAMERLLKSRFHALAGRHTVLLEVRGRRTGRLISVPVTAVPAAPGEFTVRSRADRKWWRNLRDGAPVGVWIGGEHRTGTGTVLEAPGQDPVVSLRLD